MGQPRGPRVVILNDTYSRHHPGTQAVMRTLLDELTKNNVASVASFPVGRDWRLAAKNIIDSGPTHAIINGEGTIHHSEDRPRARLLIDAIPWLKRQGCKVALLNATIYKVESSGIVDIAQAHSVVLRDTFSRNQLEEHGFPAQSIPDLSLLTRDPLVTSTQINRTSRLLFTDSVLSDQTVALSERASQIGGAWFPFSSARRGAASKRVQQVLVKRIAKLEAQVSLTKKLKYAKLEHNLNRPQDALKAFSDILIRSGGLITGRFHAVTLALSLQVPFLAVHSNTPKIAFTLLDALGSEERVSQQLTARAPWKYSSDELLRLEQWLRHGHDDWQSWASMFLN